MQENDPKKSIDIRREKLNLIKNTLAVADKSFVDKAQSLNDELLRSVAYSNNFLQDYIDEIDKTILDQTFDFIRKDNIHYARPDIKYKTADYNRNFQQLKISNDAKNIVRARIGFYVDWRYPGLEIGPGDAEWTNMLVACDPLYVVDHNDEFLKSTKDSFNEVYQNRMRFYLNNGHSLYMLPQNQFGFIFSWNTFNYFSFNQINKYLKEVHNVLRPGGACMFSYNNAELPICALRSEEHLMSFIPEQLLRKVVASHGFTDIKTNNVDESVSWIEFRKPGIAKTNKTGQALGKIILRHHVKA